MTNFGSENLSEIPNLSPERTQKIMNEQAFLPLAGPLAGQTVLVTRPENQAHSLAGLLESQGATLLLQPVIEIREPDNWSLVDAAIERMGEFSWLVFVSVPFFDTVSDAIHCTFSVPV